MQYLYLNANKSIHESCLDMSKEVGKRRFYRQTADSPATFAPDTSVAQAWGIGLDGQYLAVDIDDPSDPKAKEWLDKLPRTWTQKTRRGYHFLYSVPPSVVEEYSTTQRADGAKIDVKVNGYLTGPGSVIVDRQGQTKTYELVEAIDPVPAPEWLFEKLTKRRTAPKLDAETSIEAFVPLGKHQEFLFHKASAMRGQLGLGEEAIFHALKDQVRYLKDSDPENPFTESDLWGIANNVCRLYDREILKRELDEERHNLDVTQGAEFNVPVLNWYIHEFIPRDGYLITGYAPGGTGKSSFGHYLARLVTSAGDNFLLANHEDHPEYWKACAVVSGATPSRLFSMNQALNFQSPRDVEELEELIMKLNIKFIWFDSIKDHMENGGKTDAASATRNALSPLSQLANRTGCSMIGIFHTNKKGLPGGSTEMLNVARQVLEFSREENDLFVRVDKSNIGKPDYALVCPATKVPIVDPSDSERKLFARDRNGELVVREVYSIQSHYEDRAKLEEMKEVRDVRDMFEQVKMLIDQGMTQKQAAEVLGINKKAVARIVNNGPKKLSDI